MAAGAYEFIERLPQGFDTPAGEAGARLSGGERQRITIARAMLKNADVVILDEATAYADPENEALVERADQRTCRRKDARDHRPSPVHDHRRGPDAS